MYADTLADMIVGSIARREKKEQESINDMYAMINAEMKKYTESKK